MPHTRIAEISGVPHVHMAKGSHFEHNTHATRGHNEIPGKDMEALNKDAREVYGRRWIMPARKIAAMSGVPQAAHFQDSPLNFEVPKPAFKRAEHGIVKLSGEPIDREK